MERKHLSIVIPAYNEENRIGKTIDKILHYINNQKYPYEIIIIDDGSIDETVSVVMKSMEHNEHIKLLNNKINKGKGYCIKKGILEANGKYVLFTDADLSTPVEEVEKLLSQLEKGYDIAIGSRSLAGSDIILRQPLYRELMGKVFNRFVRLLAVKEFVDTQCGFKLFRRDAARTIFKEQRLNGFAFDVEILYLARKNGFKIKEVPIKWINSPDSKVSPVSSSIGMFFDLLKIKKLHRK